MKLSLNTTADKKKLANKRKDTKRKNEESPQIQNQPFMPLI